MTTYIAKQDLFIADGVSRAHNAGDIVPSENVKPNNWEHLVAVVKSDDKPAEAKAPAGK